ncbi:MULTISPECIES: ABC transporter substrate-binding protein [Agrobacterium]|uniref:ABC transporter substrate-binding protein n=1 Tax=Agrobacterium rubi TaxID=28099 RepID=A0AAE7RDH7_9HYPH|nr:MULTISPECIES: ABC transporter substrate-binding protein [Agrobacterium]MBN7809208.1 ABC transporter substrate-binding protein [Agrobacterium rosae]NTE89850.1 ABC transporter substrate-binding protein [Agrobacterium rubi]NTF05300.1 ABC transporter substrate-binding protein [Agrobacterium rubi]NTF39744.1 ABC transporter substrate-binding protein [Agrobacterium rubi]OCJ44939.1 hypothetical protein A6U92_17115 [Agrobacterium rubi]
MKTELTRRKLMQTTAVAGAVALLTKTGAFAADQSKTMVIASPATPQGMDFETDISLGSIDTNGALYDRLVGFKKIADPENPAVLREDVAVHSDQPGGMALEGALAESWDLSEDGRSVTFHLREGVKSNWGNLLTPEDVKYSWLRKLNMKSSGTFFTDLLGIASEDQIKIDGPKSVSFHLEKPSALLLKLHTNHQTGVFDSAKLKAMASTDDPWSTKFLKSESAGYGPYKIRQIARGQQAIFDRHKDYWGPAPFFDTVVMREVPSSASRLSLLQGGAVDIAQFLSPREVNSLKGNANVAIDAVTSSYFLNVMLNAKVTPFDNPLVRQAMNYLVPRQEIIDAVFYGMASKQTGFLPVNYPMVDHSLFHYEESIDKAKELLKEAGHPNGFTTTLTYDAGSPVQESLALIYQTSLRRAGIEVTLEKLPAGVFYDAIAKKQKPAIFYLDAPWSPDPYYAANLYFKTGNFVNYSNYSNATVDELLNSARYEVDDAKRTALFKEIQTILMEDAPWGLVVYPKFILARKSNIKGFTYYTSNALRFQDFSRG